ASPESFRSTRPNTAAGGDGPFTAEPSRLAHLEPRKPADDHVLAGLGGQRCPNFLDRLPAVDVLFDVLLPEQVHVVEPRVDLALDDLVAHVLGAVGCLLGGDPLLALALVRWKRVLRHGQRSSGRYVEGEVARELDELVGAGDEIGLAVHLDQYPDLVPSVDVLLDDTLAGLRSGPLGRLGLALGAQDLHRAVGIAAGLLQRPPAVQDPGAGPLSQGLDVAGRNRAHASSRG